MLERILKPFFRQAAPAPGVWNVAKTLFQTAIFWTFFLVVIPFGITSLEATLEVIPFSFFAQGFVSWFVFVIAGSLGLLSGITMALAGQGTPLPSDCPRQLVIAGPYRFVRNPMAIAGISQGVAVGVFLGSWGSIIYSLAGGVFWHYFVRPIEEKHLEEQFAEAYKAYKAKIKCWIPRFVKLD